MADRKQGAGLSSGSSAAVHKASWPQTAITYWKSAMHSHSKYLIHKLITVNERT